MKRDTSFPFSMYKETGEGRIISPRCHKSKMEIIEVTSGEVNIRVGTDSVIAGRGDIIYVPPTLMMSCDAVDSSASLRGLIFSSSIFEENMEKFDVEVFDMFYIQSKTKMTILKPDHPIHSTISVLMHECYEEFSAREICYKLPIRANIYLMMTSLLRYYCGSKNELDRMIYHNVLRLRPVMDYISEHFKEKIYIEELADMINVSADYFTKMFKESIGKTPIDYINAMRVNYSMELLTTTEMAMSDIADIIGFCNPNYFHKIFKQYIDMSPLGYRKSVKA